MTDLLTRMEELRGGQRERAAHAIAEGRRDMPASPSPELLSLVDQFESETFAAEVEQAEREAIQQEGAGRDKPAPCLFVDDEGLAQLPTAEWVLQEIIPAGGLVYLLGLPGVGKTLLALQWATHISLGLPWCGYRTHRGVLRYVAAEGARSLHLRLAALKDYTNHTGSRTGVLWYPQRLHLLDAQAVERFIAECRAYPAPTAAIFIDTFARCTQGIRENDSDGVGRALEAIDRIRESLGAAVIVLAHPAREGHDTPRGHSSQDGAADAIWSLKDQENRLELTCAKNKDGPETVALSLTLVAHQNSMVIAPLRPGESHGSRTKGQRTVLAAIRDTDHGRGVNAVTIAEAGKLHKATVHRALKVLHDARLVSAKGPLYSLTPGGLALISESRVA